MSDENFFLDEIRCDRADDGPRLVYADWLEEHGDPRAELIRVQCELAKLGSRDRRRIELEGREQDLLAMHRSKWFSPLYQLGISVFDYHRGFVERCRFDCSHFLHLAEEMTTAAPVVAELAFDRVPETDAPALSKRLAELDPRLRLEALDLSSSKLDGRDVERIVARDLTKSLCNLNLSWSCRVGERGVEALGSVCWPKLRVLDLRGICLGVPSARRIAQADAWPELRLLLVSGAQFGGVYQILRERFRTELMVA